MIGLLPPGTYDVDPLHTFLIFDVRHLVFGRVCGRFDTLKGDFEVIDDRERPFGRIALEIDAASINTNVVERDNDLRSGRFFNVKAFPTIIFRGAGGSRKGEDCWMVAGEATIGNVTHALELEVAFHGMIYTAGKSKAAFHLASYVSRSDFGLLTDLQQESGDHAGASDVEIFADTEAFLRT
jgi:polyisoprenoid-binding protein YceI